MTSKDSHATTGSGAINTKFKMFPRKDDVGALYASEKTKYRDGIKDDVNML